MGDYHPGVPAPGGGRRGHKGSGHFAMPQRCELEVCHLPDWQMYDHRERFSSSSPADSESEEDQSKRSTTRDLAGPQRPGGNPPRGPGQRRRSLSVAPPGVSAFRGRRLPQASHSSSDDEVFDSLPQRYHAHHNQNHPYQNQHHQQQQHNPRSRAPNVFHRHPPPFPETLDGFAPPHHPSAPPPPTSGGGTSTLGPAPREGRDCRFRPSPLQAPPHQPPPQPRRWGEPAWPDKDGATTMTTAFHKGPLLRGRPHSLPPGGREFSRERDSSHHAVDNNNNNSNYYYFRDCDTSPRGRSQFRGYGGVTAEGALGQGRDQGQEEEFKDLSGDEYLYPPRHGYGEPQYRGRERGRYSTGTSSGRSDGSTSSYRQMSGNSSDHCDVQGRLSSSGGFLTGKGSTDKWSVVSQQALTPGHKGRRHQGSVATPYGPFPPFHHLHGLDISFPGYNSMEGKVQYKKVSDMTLGEKLHRFMLFVRHEGCARVNDIQTIENAITGCHLDLRTCYEAEDVGVYLGRHTFSGKLTLSGVFLARAVGQVKKELKHECYKLALQVLKTKDVAEILRQHDIGIEAIRAKFEECSRQDAASNVSQAVENLATAAPIAVAMETVATMEERWADFVSYLQTLNPDMGNTISRIEMALSGSRCGLERCYVDVATVDPVQGRPGFQGSLSVGGALQAQAQGLKKKEAKQRTYDLAFHRFTSLQVDDLLKGVEPQSVEEFRREGRNQRVAIKEIRTAEHIKKFELFIDRVKDSSVREGPVTLLDLTANQLQLLITCMYTRGDQPDTQCLCRLFIGDILISEGEGKHKKEAQADAYHKAYDVLISTPLPSILADSHRLNRDELEGPDVQDVVVKGQMKKEESNLPRLRSQYPNVEEALSEKDWGEMVVVEHEDWAGDRKRHAFCILQNSALLNVMVLKWGTEIETGFFTCRVHVQGEELGVAKAHSRQQARSLAAADVLFKMYETQPVLRIVTSDPSGTWITREQLEERLSRVPQSELDEVDADFEASEVARRSLSSKSDSEDGSAKESTDEDKETRKLERRLRHVALQAVGEFCEGGDILAELVFAPDLPPSVRRALPAHVTKLGMRATQCQKDGRIYLAIHIRSRVDKIVAEMKGRGVTRTSRFLLVEDRSELPCHADIEEDIEVARTLSRQDRLAARAAPPRGFEGREGGVGGSTGGLLNGSLFEETMAEGYVTAQTSMLADADTSALPPPPPTTTSSSSARVPSTPKCAPGKRKTRTPPASSSSSPSTSPSSSSSSSAAAKKSRSPRTTQPASGRKPSPPKAKTPPVEVVYAKFARAMMASGVGQTLLPMEASTPVSNILVNPPTCDHVTRPARAGAAPVIKNILISPPGQGAAVGMNVTLSSPVKSLSVSACHSSSSFPQPDFSSLASPGREERMAVDGSRSSASGSGSSHSPRSSDASYRRSPASASPGHGRPPSSSGDLPPAKPPRLTAASNANELPPSSAAGVVDPQQITGAVPMFVPSVVTAANVCPSAPAMTLDPHAQPVHFSVQSHFPAQAGYYHQSYATRAGYHGYQAVQGGGVWRGPVWCVPDPSAPHAIQMSPASNNSGYVECGRTYPSQQGQYGAAVYVENEVPLASQRRWNYGPSNTQM